MYITESDLLEESFSIIEGIKNLAIKLMRVIAKGIVYLVEKVNSIILKIKSLFEPTELLHMQEYHKYLEDYEIKNNELKTQAKIAAGVGGVLVVVTVAKVISDLYSLKSRIEDKKDLISQCERVIKNLESSNDNSKLNNTRISIQKGIIDELRK